MSADFSWERSARQYLGLYGELRERRFRAAGGDAAAAEVVRNIA